MCLCKCMPHTCGCPRSQERTLDPLEWSYPQEWVREGSWEQYSGPFLRSFGWTTSALNCLAIFSSLSLNIFNQNRRASIILHSEHLDAFLAQQKGKDASGPLLLLSFFHSVKKSATLWNRICDELGTEPGGLHVWNQPGTHSKNLYLENVERTTSKKTRSSLAGWSLNPICLFFFLYCWDDNFSSSIPFIFVCLSARVCLQY